MQTYKSPHGHTGLLIVIEGTDGSGKSTQINLLKRWIEDQSYGAMVSEWKTSRFIAGAIDNAKDRNLLNATTFSLLYAADFTDRLETTILPALKAGFVVLLDRYTYTALARDVVRGHDEEWVQNLYSYAPKPDLVFYLDVPVETLLKRIIGSNGLDYWESGRDIGLSSDFYKSFQIYQGKCLDEYQKMVEKHGFITLDGTQPEKDIHNKIISDVKKLLSTGALD